MKHGNAPAVHSSIHKPHGGSHAHVVSQPSALPNEVNQPYNEEKYTAAAHAPSHEVRTPAYHPTIAYKPTPYHPAPTYKPAPIYRPTPAYKPTPYQPTPAYKPAPYHPTPAYKPTPYHPTPAYKPNPYHPTPAYKPVPVHHPTPTYKPTPYHPTPSYKPTPAYKPAPYHPAPAYKPAPYHPAPAHGHGDEYETAPAYQYGYAVADDYSGSNFAQNENRDNYATNGEYRVALPDGRTQIVSYSVADAYSGYVADVRYEGEAKYEPDQPAHKNAYHPAPAPGYHA
eukprot:TCALIF_10126-PA protein Name:"Similar to Pclo Protein piccolo (Mus musculus)" AED:0.41 eAED:0.41 QI:270/0/0.5/1/1/1/2/0/282